MYDFSILGGKKVNDSHKKRETDHGGPPKVVLLEIHLVGKKSDELMMGRN